MFKGSITALATPFRNGKVDEPAVQNLVERQIVAGSHGLVPVGTTGESPTLSHEEHDRVVSLVVEAAARKVPVIAGAGSNSTEEAVRLIRHAKTAGADGALVVTPYYNKPSQEMLYQHFRAVHDAADLPIIIYNIPGRCVVDMSVATMARLADLPNIVGVKDATMDLGRPLDTRLAIGPDFVQLSGEDPTVVAFLAQGGHGCISVTSNVAPAECAHLHNAWQAGDLGTVAALRDRLMPLHRALFVEPNPVPVKYALSRLGLCTDEVRLPLTPANAETRGRVDAALLAVGLLDG